MHHTRKNRSLKKNPKGLKKSRSKRSLKKKSTKSRKMKGGLASCNKKTHADYLATDIATAWNKGNFTIDLIIKAIVLLIKRFNTLLGSDQKVVKYTVGNNTNKVFEKTKVVDKPEELVSKLLKLNEREYNNVADVLEEDFKFYTVTDSTAQNTKKTSDIYKTEVDKCQLMKTIFYLMQDNSMRKSEDNSMRKSEDNIESRNLAYYENDLNQNMGRMKMFIDNKDVSKHFMLIAPELKISTIVAKEEELKKLADETAEGRGGFNPSSKS